MALLPSPCPRCGGMFVDVDPYFAKLRCFNPGGCTWMDQRCTTAEQAPHRLESLTTEPQRNSTPGLWTATLLSARDDGTDPSRRGFPSYEEAVRYVQAHICHGCWAEVVLGHERPDPMYPTEEPWLIEDALDTACGAEWWVTEEDADDLCFPNVSAQDWVLVEEHEAMERGTGASHEGT